MHLRLERRETTPLWLQLVLPLAAVLVTLLLCAALVRLAGADVLDAYAELFLGPVRSSFDLQQTLIKTAPLVLTGLAVTVAFRAKFWNIGAEGQLLAGAVAAGFVGQRMILPDVALVPLMLAAGAAGGAAIALLPALLRVRLRVDDVVTTLLLNSITLYALMALLEGAWKDPHGGFPSSAPIRPEAEFPMLGGSDLHLGVVVALVAAVLTWALIARTTLGFAIRAVGAGAPAARYAGIRVDRVLVTAAAISGALAGLAGAGEVGGVHFLVISDISPGYGYAGIVVAMLAELNPLGVVPAALFFAMVLTGAESMSRATGVPVYLAQVIQGVALLAMVGIRLFATYRLRVGRDHA
ncbi:ABC transporter permease [Rhodovastum atsumiense]|uniref:ABC transporter permease n=2 Tax=Rhodovastum atsumiense TaxID=504468 RepID=A0A5M6IPN2_9PROT|nr:ABC transporter permease [Rhodovastum atsumiense]CAH2600787.1 ABC transporter permease [Rhodovastum atsumiense]